MGTGYEFQVVVALLAGLVGGVLRGFSGFGFGMAAVPILMIGIPPIQAIPAVLIHEIAIGAAAVPGLWKSVAWDKLGALTAGSLIGTPAGLALLTIVPATTMRLVIGVVVLASVILLWVMPKINVRLTPANLGLTGLASGILNGSTAASGPPAIIMLFASGLPAKEVRSLLILFILASAAIAILISALGGFIVWPVIETSALMVPGVVIGALTGNFLFNRLDIIHYRQISLALLFLVSAVTLFLNLTSAT